MPLFFLLHFRVTRPCLAVLCACAVLLAGCVATGRAVDEQNRLAVPCSGTAQCDRYWARALDWVNQNSSYPVKNATGWAILTEVPSEYKFDLAYRVIRWPRDDGGQDLVFTANCSPFLPCVPQPATAFEKFRAYVIAP